MMKAVRILALLACCALPAVAQMGSWSYGITKITHTLVANNCIEPNGINCWHTSTSTLVLTSVSSGRGATYGLDYTGALYQYNDYPTNTWTTVSGVSAVSQIAVLDNNFVYALESSQSGGCTLPNIGVVYWNGSGNWQRLGTQCAVSISAAGDGTLTEVRANSAGYVSTNGGAGWSTITTSGLSSSLVKLAAAFSGDYYAIDGAGIVYKGNGSSAWTSLGVAGSWGTSAIAVDVNDNLYAIGTNNRGFGYPLHYNGSGWDSMVGPNSSGSTSSLGNSGQSDIWALAANGGHSNIYRLAFYGVQKSRTLSGNASCSGSCGSVIHSAYVRSGWNGNTVSAYNNSFPPTTTLNITATAVLPDPFDCFEGNVDCTEDDGGAVTCSEDGFLFTDAPTTNPFEWAVTYEEPTGSGTDCQSGTLHFWKKYCNFPTQAACTNSTIPGGPDLPPANPVNDYSPSNPAGQPPITSPPSGTYWRTKGLLFWGGLASPSWNTIFTFGNWESDGAGECTYNPNGPTS